MKLSHAAKALVTVTLDARTKVDHRMRRLDTTPMLKTVLGRYGFKAEHADANGLLYAVNLPCASKECAATWHDREGHPSMRFDTRSAVYPSGSPEFVVCSICGAPRETASAIFERLCTKNRAKALDAWTITRLPAIDFTAVRCNGKTALGGSFQSVAEQVCPKRFDADRDFEAVLIRAPDARTASEALRSPDFPSESWVTVPVTHELWPKAAWHNERMTATDSAPIERYRRQQDREAQAAVEAEVARFRSELAQRQRGA
jgi:hypothetical protein